MRTNPILSVTLVILCLMLRISNSPLPGWSVSPSSPTPAWSMVSRKLGKRQLFDNKKARLRVGPSYKDIAATCEVTGDEETLNFGSAFADGHLHYSENTKKEDKLLYMVLACADPWDPNNHCQDAWCKRDNLGGCKEMFKLGCTNMQATYTENF